MEHKNITNMVFFVVLFSAFMHSASAENSTLGDDVADFHSTWGAQMRLLQLESAITRNILQGNEIIAAIKTKNASMNTTELESILVELEVLKQEVSNATPESGEEGAQKFVDMKEDAIRLTNQFRKTAKSMLKLNEVEGLQKRLQMIQHEELKNMGVEIEEKRNQYNAERVSEFLKSIGVNDTALLNEIRSGNATKKDVKDALKDATWDMGKAKKAQIALITAELHRKDKIFVRVANEMVTHNQSERIRERMEERVEKAEATNISEELIEKMHERIERFENETEDKIERFENKTEEQIDEFRKKTAEKVERFENRSEEKLDRFENRTEEQVEKFRNKTEDKVERFRNRTEEKIERFQNRTDDETEEFYNKNEEFRKNEG